MRDHSAGVRAAVYRLVLITDLSPPDPIFQAQTMVEYEPVEIGGKTYICPRKSVTITTAISPIQNATITSEISPTLRQGCWGAAGMTADCTPLEVFILLL